MAAFAKTAPHSDPILDVSYLSLRKSIGWIGILMPWVVRAVANLHGGAPLVPGHIQMSSRVTGDLRLVAYAYRTVELSG